MGTFNHKSMYICECGKQFSNSQSFNGHKCHCKIHQTYKHGSLDYIEQIISNRSKTYSENAQCKRLERNKQKILIWISEQHKCEKCGKIMTEKFGSGRFCSRACANSHNISDKTKNKISTAWANKRAIRHKDLKYCKSCGIELSYKNKSGFCKECIKLTSEYKQRYIDAGKKGYETMKKNGTHKGWQSRKIISYAEQFWMDVLDNNNISYEHNKPIKKEDNLNNYFLDFCIEKHGVKLDLEIDGKQHKYTERHLSDSIRDTYIHKLGFIVYRVDWNEIQTISGKELMKQKIDKFLDYYKQL